MRTYALLVTAIVSLGLSGLSCKGEEEPPPPPPPPECGNGLLEAGESCEGLPPPVGCDMVTCTVEPEYFCVPEVPVPDEGGTGGGDGEPMEWMSMCELLDTCGDGVIDPEEDCDDGDQTLMDGCSGCRVDPLWTCVGEPSECFQCGDGFIDPGEECDDGEEMDPPQDTPGCMNCNVVEGWNCFAMPPPSLCSPICGDGIWITTPEVTIGFAEECDDGNNEPGDGCNASCNVEPDCECTGSPPQTATCVCGLGSSSGDSTGGDSSSSDGGSSSSGGSSSTG